MAIKDPEYFHNYRPSPFKSVGPSAITHQYNNNNDACRVYYGTRSVMQPSSPLAASFHHSCAPFRDITSNYFYHFTTFFLLSSYSSTVSNPLNFPTSKTTFNRLVRINLAFVSLAECLIHSRPIAYHSCLSPLPSLH